jgi:DDE superfamily endonuclease
MGILFTNTVCWAAFERAGLGEYSPSALSWMFRHSKLLWDALLPTSVSLVLSQMKTLTGVLVADDSDHRRAKRTTRIFGAHKIFDKKTGGYFNGQCIVILLLVTPLVTLPVGFRFYRPDSKLTQWRKEDERLKKLGVKKNQRPREPKRDPNYPTKAELVLEMIREFRKHHPKVKIQAVLADALFGTQSFMDEACELSEQTQTISQLRSNQKIMFRNREKTLDTYFSAQPETSHRIRVRGGQEIEVKMSSARLHVVTHGKKRFVVALKYPGEVSYRYLVATDLSWRTLDIIKAYTLRWLVEVFFADWKLYEGWGQLAKQPDEEGSCRGLILSLLLDHALLLHPEQRARFENNKPACTVGSLQRLSRGEAFVECVRRILTYDNPAEYFESLVEKIKALFPFADSEKHMSGRDLGRMEPTPSLQRHAARACMGM